MPGSAGSSWYYMRYIDPNNDEEFADTLMYGDSLSAEDLGFPVDSYGLLMVDDGF